MSSTNGFLEGFKDFGNGSVVLILFSVIFNKELLEFVLLLGLKASHKVLDVLVVTLGLLEKGSDIVDDCIFDQSWEISLGSFGFIGVVVVIARGIGLELSVTEEIVVVDGVRLDDQINLFFDFWLNIVEGVVGVEKIFFLVGIELLILRGRRVLEQRLRNRMMFLVEIGVDLEVAISIEKFIQVNLVLDSCVILESFGLFALLNLLAALNDTLELLIIGVVEVLRAEVLVHIVVG